MPGDTLKLHSPPFEKRVLLGSLIVIALLSLVFAVWQFSFVFLLVFAAILMAIFLRGTANLLEERTKLGPDAALGVVAVSLLAITIGVGFLLAPRVSSQFGELQESLPSSVEQLKEYVRTLPMGGTLAGALDDGALMDGNKMGERMTKIFTVTLGSLVQFAFVVVVGIYLAVRPQAYVQGVLKLVPMAHRGRACEVMNALGYTLQWWLVGQLCVMTFVGVATATGLALLGIPLALTLGVIAGLLDFVPNVGPIIAAIPGLLIAFMAGPEKVLYVLILYVVIQQLEGYVLSPLVQKKTVSLEPALTITAQLGFGLTAGALGVLLATPMIAAGMVAVKMLYVEDVLGDTVEVEGADRENGVCALDPR